MEIDTKNNIKKASPPVQGAVVHFGPVNTVMTKRRIFKHHVNLANWNMALLDDKNSVTVVNKDFEVFATFEGTHSTKARVSEIKCLSEHVVTASTDQTIKFWNLKEKKQDATITYEKEVFSFALSGVILAAGLQGGNIELRNMQTGQKVAVIEECHMDDVTCLNFCLSNPKLLLSGSDDGYVCVHDLSKEDIEEAMETMMNLEYPVNECDFVTNTGNTCYVILNYNKLLTVAFGEGDDDDDAVTEERELYDGSREVREYLGFVRGMDDTLNYFLLKEKCIEVRGYLGELKGIIKMEHSLLVRGAGIFGNYFFTYGDDRKLVFHEKKSVQMPPKSKKEKRAEVDNFANDMLIEEESPQGSQIKAVNGSGKAGRRRRNNQGGSGDYGNF